MEKISETPMNERFVLEREDLVRIFMDVYKSVPKHLPELIDGKLPKSFFNSLEKGVGEKARTLGFLMPNEQEINQWVEGYTRPINDVSIALEPEARLELYRTVMLYYNSAAEMISKELVTLINDQNRILPKAA